MNIKFWCCFNFLFSHIFVISIEFLDCFSNSYTQRTTVVLFGALGDVRIIWRVSNVFLALFCLQLILYIVLTHTLLFGGSDDHVIVESGLTVQYKMALMHKTCLWSEVKNTFMLVVLHYASLFAHSELWCNALLKSRNLFSFLNFHFICIIHRF